MVDLMRGKCEKDCLEWAKKEGRLTLDSMGAVLA